MSARNDDNAAIGMAFAIMGTVGLIFFAVFVFIALALSVVALVACVRPLRLGSLVIEPHEARLFLLRGLAGAALLPVFVLFCEMLFDVSLDWDFWGGYLLLGGYTAGSLGIAILEAMDEEEAPPVPIQPAPLPTPVPPPAKRDEPFRYASWNDEEERS